MIIIDTIVYALLRKRITSALTGVKDIHLDADNKQMIVFVTNDGTEFKIEIPTPDLVWVGDEPPAENSAYELWIDTSTEGATSLNRALLEEEIVASTEIGSVKKGKIYPIGTSLETIIREMLTSYSKPVIVITPDPSKDLYDEVEETLASIITKAKVTKGTNDIQSISFYVDKELDKMIDKDVKNGGTFESNHIFDPETNKTFVLKVTVNDGKENTTVTKTITFVSKSYWGFVPEIKTAETMTEEDIKGLQNNTLKNSRSLTYSEIPIPQDGDLYKICYCYPKSLGALTKIIDDYGFSYFDSYDRAEIQVDEIDYYCYIMHNGSGTDGATHKYS